ncbi:hypothetical protein C7S18_23590 (plasmid) [Ahniella affigens]|uniref:Type 4 secretion system PilS N-terminal domain-containing protein n=1 Tax=Ahniella affigens TaxID=2021234 RepID=A0A2P1PZL0_9GAMM|nr:type 4 pilus major pilin [Ahniella affigens]AVQ00283.1 hypothetical protein C7S18_23590 [Ahniella affigens]
MRNIKFVPAKNQVAGNSILEFNLYNVLILIAAAGLLAAFIWSQTAGKVTDTKELLSQIQVGVKSEYPNGGPYTGMTAATLAGNQSLPANRLNGNNIKNPIGLGNVTLAPATYPTGNTDGAYSITLTLDTAACSKIVAGVESQFEQIVVAGTTVKDRSAGTSYVKATADGRCQSAATVTAVFTNQ